MSDPSSQKPSMPKTIDLDREQEPKIAERLAYLCLTEQDATILRSYLPTFEKHAEEFVDSFYQHLSKFPEPAQFLHDPKLVETLKKTQCEHLKSMLEARWDEEFVARRTTVGDAHAEVGIHPEIFLGAYNQYAQWCFPHFLADKGKVGQEVLEQILPLLKSIFLDIGLTLRAYFHQSTQDLRHALDIVWQSNEELQQFAQLTSHDLKTPLATVANLCDEALDEFGDQMPEDASALIEAARDRMYRISDTIDELLKNTMSSTKKNNLTEVDSYECLTQAVERVRPLIESRELKLTILQPLPTIWANKIRLREAFYNLISNAAKFIPRQTGHIKISATKTETCWKFCIEDNGPGVPEEERERIFAPFRRLRSHHDEEGTGLGLYFAKAIIQNHHGRIWVESELGKGSQFYIELPLQAVSR